MGALSRRNIKASLRKKGFEETIGDHYFYQYRDTNGNLTTLRTKVSYTRKSDVIGAGLVSTMAKQVKLSTSEFEQFVQCTISQNQYETIALQRRNEK